MIRIVTDSGASLAPETAIHPRLSVAPLYIISGSKSYRDQVDLTTPQLLDLMRSSPDVLTTSQPSAGDFRAIFERLAADGSEVLSIHLSAKLSGTYASAEAARQMLAGRPITVMDSNSVSMGQGMMVAEALRSADAGLTVLEILPRVRYVGENVRIGFVVDTLEYMRKGGRIGKASAFLGTLLSVKPVLSIRDGEVYPVDKVRTRRRAIDRLMEMLVQEMGARREVRVGIVHLDAEGDAEALRRRCQETFAVTSDYICELSAVLGVHVGPGTVGIGVCPVCEA